MASTGANSPSTTTAAALPETLRVVTLNCWGLKYLSKHRHARLVEIGKQLAAASPPPSIVGLQECWTQEDFLAIHALTRHILPHAKFYFSGVFGGGLAILSAFPIEATAMHAYPLNGRPQAFFRGDWYVGKGVAHARLRLGPRARDVAEVFCTHLHAPYNEGAGAADSYLCHRTAQAWHMAGLLRDASARGHVALALGDFNMLPRSLAHRLVEAGRRRPRGGGGGSGGSGGVPRARDIWRELHPDSAIGAAKDAVERARGKPAPSAEEALALHGATCDSELNTWRWSAALRKELERGARPHVDPRAEDLRAKRLDYVFLADNRHADGGAAWEVEAAEVGMTARHPALGCSLSDHFSVETTLRRRVDGAALAAEEEKEEDATAADDADVLPVRTYDEILELVDAYEQRELAQQRWTLALFPASIAVSLGCLVAVWFSPRNFVAFILMLVSTLGLSAGVLAGLIGGLFVSSELRTLKEFRYEIQNARDQAAAAGRKIGDQGSVHEKVV